VAAEDEYTCGIFNVERCSSKDIPIFCYFLESRKHCLFDKTSFATEAIIVRSNAGAMAQGGL